MGEEGSFLKLYLRLDHAILVSVQPDSFDSKKGSMNQQVVILGPSFDLGTQFSS